MKKIIFILFLFPGLVSNAQLKRKKIEQLEQALYCCLESKGCVNDTIYIFNVIEKNAPKKEEKTKRKVSKIEAKTENKTQKQKTKRNFFFQFFQTIRTFIGSLTLGQIFGGGAGSAGLLTGAGLFFEKYKPLSRIFGFVNKK